MGFIHDGSNVIANHVLVFMACGITSDFKHTVGYFGTNSATADELYPLFWDAVYHLEIQCNLKVTSPKTSKGSCYIANVPLFNYNLNT